MRLHKKVIPPLCLSIFKNKKIKKFNSYVTISRYETN